MTNPLRRYADLRKLFSPGRASDFIQWAKYALKPGDLVVIWCRVSGYTQHRRKNLRDQEQSLRRYAEARGAIVIDVVSVVESGFESWSLSDAARIAQKHGAKVLAETTDRYIRHPMFHSRLRPHLQPLETHFRTNFHFLKDRATFMTVEDPDAPLSKCRGRQIKRGQQAKNRKGGRPCEKKQRRTNLAPRAREMNRAGSSIRQIATALKVPSSTIFDWLESVK